LSQTSYRLQNITAHAHCMLDA